MGDRGDYQQLLDEAESADVSGWDFSWLYGRATEERPPWGYSRLLATQIAQASAALDLDTGGGEVLMELDQLPEDMWATESWRPNYELAVTRLAPRGVRVVLTDDPDSPLPFPDERFDLVVARHPVTTNWGEVSRVLRANGRYFAQHVGPGSARELTEYVLGAAEDEPSMSPRDPGLAVAEAQDAGLSLVSLSTARCKMEFYDVGAVVYILRKCVWWVPDFEVRKYDDVLWKMHQQIESQGPFIAHSTRFLIELVKTSVVDS